MDYFSFQLLLIRGIRNLLDQYPPPTLLLAICCVGYCCSEHAVLDSYISTDVAVVANVPGMNG